MDDDNLVQGAIPYGYRCQHNKVLYKEIWEAEDIKAALDDDNRTMQVMVDLANTIGEEESLVQAGQRVFQSLLPSLLLGKGI